MQGNFYPYYPWYYQQFPPPNYQNYYHPDPWLSEFIFKNQVYLQPTKFEWTTENVKQALNEIKTLIHGEQSEENKKRLKELYSIFYYPNDEFTCDFKQFQNKIIKKKRKYKWRKKKREIYAIKKPDIIKKNQEISAEVDKWFEIRTAEMKEQRLQEKNNKEQQAILKKQKKKKNHLKKVLTHLIPLLRLRLSSSSPLLQKKLIEQNEITKIHESTQEEAKETEANALASNQCDEPVIANLSLDQTNCSQGLIDQIVIRSQWDSFLVPVTESSAEVPEPSVKAPMPPPIAWLPFITFKITPE